MTHEELFAQCLACSKHPNLLGRKTGECEDQLLGTKLPGDLRLLLAKPETQRPGSWSAPAGPPASPWGPSPLGFVHRMAEMEELGQGH